MLIYKKIIEVMKAIDFIGKNSKNSSQNYAFRGIDDVYNELHHKFAEHGVFSVPEVLEERTEERQTKSGTNLIYRVLKIKFTFFAEDGSSVCAVVIGEGMDSGDKAANKAMSVAHKYALMQLLTIPTKEPKDPECDSPQVVAKDVYAPSNMQQKMKILGWMKAYDVSPELQGQIGRHLPGMLMSKIEEFVIKQKERAEQNL